MVKLMRVVYFLLFGVITLGLRAQDIHFSQFYLSPLNLNPAMTGVMNCNIRFTTNYRNQWASVLKNNAFNTYSFSYDQKFNAGRNDYFGIGGTFWGDRAGEANFKTMTGKLSFSYSKKMGGTKKQANYLVAGAEAGGAQRSIDFLNLRWGTQHDGAGGFDPTLPSQETRFDRDNFLFADMGAGLLWFMVFDEFNSFYAGGAFHHLNRANQSFSSEGEELLFTRWTGHAGGEFKMNSKFGISPGIIVMSQGPSFQVNAGTSAKFFFGTREAPQAFHLGLWTRIANNAESGLLSDAVILSTRFDVNNITMGFSYDINVSPLNRASNGQGSFEFALVYKICNLARSGVYCPDF
jgi:type IX secretion system PorP/SprF family membrane protein